MSIALAFMAIQGASAITGGIGSHKAAGAQKKIAKLQHEYNQKEIDRAFEKNLMFTMSNYATQRSELVSEASKVAGELRLSMTIDNGTDKEMNSYRDDVITKLDSELDGNMKSLITEQAHTIGELSSERAMQKYQSAMSLSYAMSGANAQKQQANQQILGGAMAIGMAGADKFMGGTADAKAALASGGTTGTSLNSFGYSSYKPASPFTGLKLSTGFTPNPKLLGGFR